MSVRNWCFTYNHPEHDADEVTQMLIHAGALYVVFQHEAGDPKNGTIGTPHYQGYVEFDTKHRLAAVKKMITSTVHWEKRLGTREQARDYCMKDDTRIAGPFEYGSWRQKRGARTDLLDMHAAVRSGASRREIVNQYPVTAAQYPQGLALYFATHDTTRVGAPTVNLLYGPTGCGKTRLVYDECEDLWVQPIGAMGTWCDGYDGQANVLFDDFAGKLSKWSLVDILRMLDRYTVRVPIKGGFVQWLPSHIWLTTNIHPRHWYNWSTREQQYPALARRIDNVFIWNAEGTDRFDFERPPPSLLRTAGSPWYRFWHEYEDRVAVPIEPIPVPGSQWGAQAPLAAPVDWRIQYDFMQ